MTVEELNVKVTADVNGLKKGMSDLKREVSSAGASVEASAEGMERSLASILPAVTVAAVVAGLAKIGKAALSAASDLQEVQNVVDTAFGDMAGAVQGFADEAVKRFGISELTAKRLSSTYMAMSASAGIAGEQAAAMSLKLTGLAADMASFYNADVSETAQALNGIFTGTTESLRRYGIVVTENTLEQYRQAQGIAVAYSQMDEASKIALRYQYVLEATNLAQGDFAKTSGSWANQCKLMNEQWGQLMTNIGQGLVQVLTPVLQVLNNILSFLVDITRQINEFLGITGNQLETISYSASALESMGDSAGFLAMNLGNVTDGVKGTTAAVTALKRNLMGFDELNILADMSRGGTANNALGNALTGGAFGGGTGGTISTNAFEPIKKALGEVKTESKESSSALKDFGKKLGITGEKTTQLSAAMARQSEGTGAAAGAGINMAKVLEGVKKAYKAVDSAAESVGKRTNTLGAAYYRQNEAAGKARTETSNLNGKLSILKDRLFTARDRSDKLAASIGRQNEGLTGTLSAGRSIVSSLKSKFESLSGSMKTGKELTSGLSASLGRKSEGDNLNSALSAVKNRTTTLSAALARQSEGGNLNEALGTVKNGAASLRDAIAGGGYTLYSSMSAAKTSVNNLRDALSEIEVGVGENNGRQEKLLGTGRSFATGGTPSTGTYFWAGEAGPEVVTSAGGGSSVLNAEQLASVLYMAVDRALKGNPMSVSISQTDIASAAISGINNRTMAAGFSPLL